MKTNPNFNQRKTYNYRKLLPPKIYWIGVLAVLINIFGIAWLIFEKAEWVFILSSLAIVIVIGALGTKLEEDSLINSWKISVYWCCLLGIVSQLMQFIIGSLL